MDDAVGRLLEYVRCSSVSTDPNARAGMEAARRFAADQLGSLGFSVEEVATPLHPILLGRRGHEHPEWPHLLVYGHYDVQPADPLDLWSSPPFEPVVRGDRVFGRGTADNKGPQVVHMEALRLALRENPDLPLRLTYLIEGEEEIGSPSFARFLHDYREDLKADFVLVSDSGSPSVDQITVTTALRGMFGLEVELTGPSKDLHSGVHGGAVVNPIRALFELCGTLHLPDGRINVPGFYDDVLPVEDWETEELKRLPLSESDYRSFLGVEHLAAHPGFSPLQSIRFAPTLEFNGVGGGFQGEGSKTVIPSRAFAKITCRLVPNQDPTRLLAALESALRERCPKGIELKLRGFGAGLPYLVVPPGKPNSDPTLNPRLAEAFARVDKGITSRFGKRPLYLREGGSIPIIADLKKIVGLDSLMVGLFTPEDNLHAPDESFSLKVMERAIPLFRDLFLELSVCRT